MSDDLIKRSDAIEMLTKVFTECEPCDKEEAVDIAVTTIKEVPSADRPQGEWLEDKTLDSFWICSVCGFPSEAFGADVLYNYCPNCGARMKGADDDI